MSLNNPPVWKYSMCSTGLKSRSLSEVMSTARDVGLDGVELWTQHVEDALKSGESLDQIKARLQETDLEVPALAAYTSFSKGPEEIAADLREIERAAELARGVGSPRIRTFAGHVPSAEAGLKEWEAAVNGIRQAACICAASGIRLAVEIHNRTYVDRLDRIKRLVDDVNEESLELIYDPFNLFVDHQDTLPALEVLYPWIKHVHFKNYQWNHQNWGLSVPVPILQGDCDHSLIISRLAGLQYEGFISFEYFGEGCADLASRSLTEIRNFLSCPPRL
ncbi:sugar phosphate isomerase/epimerase [Paenibacillus sp. J22TS3]|uniref:sugar phosphate isomerase/epimerase family protein n=1 Tax=Paenibacillus sp. J22TS3 TaxID=2807192 RepID=UPI001B224939|nr:sugar phosphate isomerase/epimerase family protein [Paenibacillus sp. J22TS3]GIP21614.1 3-dehydroshikimate dehydratase [Paenibacillus sp. J22TS3]